MRYIIRYYTTSKYFGFKRLHEREFNCYYHVIKFITNNNIKDIEIYQKVNYNTIKDGDKIER